MRGTRHDQQVCSGVGHRVRPDRAGTIDPCSEASSRPRRHGRSSRLGVLGRCGCRRRNVRVGIRVSEMKNVVRFNVADPKPLDTRSSMRYIAILFATLGLAACNTAPGTRGESQAVQDSVVQFLLTAAATDFHTHGPPDVVRFRDVRIGHVVTPSGTEQYMLCGQFLPALEGAKAEWTPFATIKTSGYEQWIGAQAAGYCLGSSVIWDKVGDLSSSLQGRLASLQ